MGVVSRRWVWLVGDGGDVYTSGVGKINNYCEDIYVPPRSLGARHAK